MPEVRCETCGQKVPKGVVGRPALDIPGQYLVSAIQQGLTVTETAKKFGISRSSVRRILAREQKK